MKKTDKSPDAAELRRRAEAKLSERKKKAAPSPATESEPQRLVHELKVHQIELEMQNDELIRARAELEVALRQYTDLYDFAPVGYFTLGRDGTIHQVNLAGANLLGVERGKLVKRRFGVFVSAQSRTTFNAFIDKVFTSGSKETCEVALMKDRSDPLWAHIEATISDASRGQREVCHAVVSDITERVQAEEALRESETRYRAVAHSANDAIISADSAGNIAGWNPSAERMFGYTEIEVSNQPLTMLMPSPYRERHLTGMARVQSGGEKHIIGKTVELEGRRKDGTEFPLEISLSEWQVAAGRFYTAIIRDITARKQVDEALRYLGRHDALTGLYNSGFFVEEMARLERGRQFPVSIVMADVDHLKETNDQQGHVAGDALLKRVAQALTAAFRAEDVVARIGGDEFAILLPATDETAAKGLLQRVRKVIQENNATHTGTPIRLSLGVSTAENPKPLSVVLKEADANMYLEKRGHGAS